MQSTTTDYQYNAINPTADVTQPAQIVFVPLASSNVCNKYPPLMSKILGSLQIITGIFLIIFNAVSLAHREYGPSIIGSGFWCGIMFIVTGSFGICAGISRTKCKIVAFMVLCIVSAVMTIIVFMFGIISAFVAIDRHTWRCRNYDRSSGTYNYDDYTMDADCQYRHEVHKAMGFCVAIFAVIEAVAAIWGSVICCKAVCCGAEPVTGVLYQTNENSQVVMIGQQVQPGQIQFVSSPLQVVPSQIQQALHTSDTSHGRHYNSPPSYCSEQLGFSQDDTVEKPLIP